MAVTDYKFAGTAANADRDSKVAWSNPDYAKADDTDYAICDVPKTTYGDWLRLTNFGFDTDDIPTGSTVVGIEFVISRYASILNHLHDSDIHMRDSTGQVGDNEASGTKWPTSIGEATYGGAEDMIGTTLDEDDVLASTFGIDFSAANSGILGASTAYVDYIKVRIYYTVPETAPTVTTQAATEVTGIGCTGNGNITDDGTNVDRRGFCYMEGTSGDPDTSDDVAYDDGSFNEGAYTKGITGLTPDTSYRVRAYVTNTASTAYGVTVQIKTLNTGTTDWKYPGTTANVDRSSKVGWINTDNAKADDTSYASCDVAESTYGDWLRLTNFGFSADNIPTGATIDGIEIVISRYGKNLFEYGGHKDSAIFMRDSTGQVGDDQADTGTTWPLTNPADATYGAADDVMGTTLDLDDVEASTFGIDISVANTNLATQPCWVDYIKIRLTWTGPESVTSIKTAFGIPIADFKTINGVPIAEVKSFMGISNID